MRDFGDEFGGGSPQTLGNILSAFRPLSTPILGQIVDVPVTPFTDYEECILRESLRRKSAPLIELRLPSEGATWWTISAQGVNQSTASLPGRTADSTDTDAAYLNVRWGTANGQMITADIDLRQGTSFSILASHVEVYAYRFDDGPGALMLSSVGMKATASISPGLRIAAGSNYFTDYGIGEIGAGGDSGFRNIPNYVDAVKARRSGSLANPINLQFWNNNAALVLPVYDVQVPAATQMDWAEVPYNADQIRIANQGAVAANLSAMYRSRL